MPEAIAKYALNSTIGTNNFKPLNEIIRDEILNGSGLLSSENLYYPSIIEEKFSISKGTIYDQFLSLNLRFNVNGTVNLRTTATVSGIDYLKLNILKNNIDFKTISFANSSRNETKSTILEFSKNDVFTFSLYGKGVGESCTASIKSDIYADVVNYSGITITK